MMEPGFILGAIGYLILGGALAYVLWSRDKERESYLRAIHFAIEEGRVEREAHRLQINELTEKIQHPELPHPAFLPDYEPSEPPKPDPAFEKVGKVYPENGDGPEDE